MWKHIWSNTSTGRNYLQACLACRVAFPVQAVAIYIFSVPEEFPYSWLHLFLFGEFTSFGLHTQLTDCLHQQERGGGFLYSIKWKGLQEFLSLTSQKINSSYCRISVNKKKLSGFVTVIFQTALYPETGNWPIPTSGCHLHGTSNYNNEPEIKEKNTYNLITPDTLVVHKKKMHLPSPGCYKRLHDNQWKHPSHKRIALITQTSIPFGVDVQHVLLFTTSTFGKARVSELANYRHSNNNNKQTKKKPT